MKKRSDVKTVVDKSISTTLAGAVLLASCTPSNELSQGNLAGIGVEQDATLRVPGYNPNSLFRSIAINLSIEDKQLLSIFSELVQDILTDPVVAADFSANPLAYLAQRGYTYQGNLDAGLLQMVTAFADEDIRTAIEERDVNEFIMLCKNKGLLALPTGLDEANLRAQIASFSNDVLSDDNTGLVPVAIALALVVAVAVVLVFVVADGPDCDDPPCIVAAFNNLSPLVLWAYNSPDTYIPINDEWTAMQFAVIEEALTIYDPQYTSNQEYRNMVDNIVKSTLLNTL